MTGVRDFADLTSDPLHTPDNGEKKSTVFVRLRAEAIQLLYDTSSPSSSLSPAKTSEASVS